MREADLPFFVELHGMASVTRWLGGDGSPRTPDMTRAWLERMIRWYREEGMGPYAVALREDDRLIGRSGLTNFEIEGRPSTPDGVPLATWGRGSAAPGTAVERIVEVGYVVHPAAWGRGYATEAARRWMEYAFEERREPVLHSLIHPENVGSRRVAEKNGMRVAGTVRMEGRDYLRYRILRPR